MRRPMFGGLILMIILMSVFAACAPKATPAPASAPAPAPAPAPKPAGPVQLVLGGGPPAGGLQARAEAVGEAIRRSAPNYQVTVQTGAFRTNTLRLGSGENNLALLGTWMSAKANKGQEPFDKAIPHRAIAPVAEMPVHFVVLAETGLTSVKEAIDKKYPLKIAVGRKASGTYWVNLEVLNAYGATFEDIEKWGGKVSYVMQAEAVGMLTDGLADAAAGAWGMPVARLLELGRKRDIRLLPLEEDVVAALAKEGLPKIVIPASEPYSWVKTPVLTANHINFLGTSPDMPEDVIYNVTKALFTNRDYLLSAHKAFRALTPDNAVALGEIIPLHEGAKKYYREIGALK